jgi:ABC-type oligopeptide transport system substrate-binding subunit
MELKRYFQFLLVAICAHGLYACGILSEEEPIQESPPLSEDSVPIEEESVSEPPSESLQLLQEELSEEGCTYNLYSMGWVLDWADAGNIVDTVFGPDSDFHYTFWELGYPDLAEEFSNITSAAYREVDFEDRAQLWGKAEDILVNEVVMVLPLNYLERVTLHSTDLNFYLPPFGAPHLSRWSSKSGSTKLVLPLGINPPTLDATMCSDIVCSMILYQLLDSPYSFKQDGSIEPLAATGFDVSEDGTVYTVHLREDALWSDGEPVLAQHFVDGVLRLLHPSTASDYAYVMMGIEGAPEYASGEASTLDSVKAIDEYTFQFRLSEPLAYFDSLLAFNVFQPIRSDLIEAYPDTYTQPGIIVSNGAFILTEYSLGSHILLEKNPFYWDATNVAYDRIEMPIIPEPATCVAAFENGEIDATSCGFPPEEIPRWVDRPEFVRVPRPGVIYLGINTLAENTLDIDLRTALAYAIDNQTINNAVLESPWKIEARGIIPPEIYGHQGDVIGFDYDVPKAQEHLTRYLERAGIIDPGDILLELWTVAGAWEDTAEAVEVMLEENLGIEVRLNIMEWNTYISVLDTCVGMSRQDP